MAEKEVKPELDDIEKGRLLPIRVDEQVMGFAERMQPRHEGLPFGTSL